MLPTLRLEIAKRVGCELAAQNLKGSGPALEQCQMGFPDLVKLYQSEKGSERSE